jgi:hypothetical protein
MTTELGALRLRAAAAALEAASGRFAKASK